MARHLRLVHSYTEGDWMTQALKVAFATRDRERVDQHFGAAEAFAIYALEPDKSALVEIAQFGAAEMDGNEDKLTPKITALQGCTLVYCLAVGGSAIRQLQSAGIQPCKVPRGTPINELLKTLRQELRDGPEVWLARALQKQTRPVDPDRFSVMDAEGWQE